MNQTPSQPAQLYPFEDWELEAYAEGVEMPDVAAFAHQQPTLWADWLRNYQQEQQQFTKLYRFDCPAKEELRCYYWHDLSEGERATVEAHLSICASCAAEYQRLSVSIAETSAIYAQRRQEAAKPKPSTSLSSPGSLLSFLQDTAEQIRLVVATIVSTGQPALTAVALRSDDPTIAIAQNTQPNALLFTTEDIDISLLVRHKTPSQIMIDGQLLPVVAPTTPEILQVKLIPAQPAQPTLYAASHQVGVFLFDAVTLGEYQLTISLTDGMIIVIPSLIFL